MMNQTQLVRSAINAFILIAVGISLFQQLLHANSKSLISPAETPTVTTPAGEQVPLQMVGPKVQGIKIQSTDKFTTPLKQLLARNQMNIQIVSYEFQGNQYWINFILNWGHMILIYVLIGKYKTQTNESTKKKLMIGGAIAVFAWFYLSSNFKPQRLAIQVNGTNIYDRDYFNDKQVADILHENEFQIEDLKQAKQINMKADIIQKDDAWQTAQQQAKKKPQPVVQEPQFQQQVEF